MSAVAAWEVGAKDAIAVVGIQGEITAKDDGSITIGGVTLPTRLSETVRYLSMVWPESGDDATGPDDSVWDDDNAQGQLENVIEEIERAHADEHEGAFRFCPSPFCRVVAS